MQCYESPGRLHLFGMLLRSQNGQSPTECRIRMLKFRLKLMNWRYYVQIIITSANFRFGLGSNMYFSSKD